MIVLPKSCVKSPAQKSLERSDNIVFLQHQSDVFKDVSTSLATGLNRSREENTELKHKLTQKLVRGNGKRITEIRQELKTKKKLNSSLTARLKNKVNELKGYGQS